MRSGLYRGLFIILAFLLPLHASAKVLISEVMYNPEGADEKHEWIELFNGYNAPVDISKWRINDGSNHIFNVPPKNGGTGSLTIPSGGTLILASDAYTFITDHSASGLSVIDTAISPGNTAETLMLIREDGTTEDSVSYTKDMGAYGDGNTLQRGSVSSATLIASTPTPGVGSLLVDDTAPPASATQDENASGTSASDSASSASVKKVSPPAAEVFADAGDDRTVAVGADVVFQGRVYDRKKNVLDDVRYVWNFGDGSSAEGSVVKHHYSYPGTYMAVLSAADEAFSISDKVKVTAELPQIALITLPDGGVELKNTSAHDRDLSNWIINANGRLLILPKDTTVFAKSSIFVSSETMGFKSDADTLLEYPNGMRVMLPIVQATSSAVFSSTPLSVARATTNISSGGSDPIAYAPSRAAKRSSPISSYNEDSTDAASSSEEGTSTSQVAAAAAASGGASLWWLSVAGLVVCVSGGILLVRHTRQKEE